MPRKKDEHYEQQPVDERLLDLQALERVCVEADRWAAQTRRLLSSLTSPSGELGLSPDDVELLERVIARVGAWHGDAWSQHRDLLLAPLVFVDNDESEVT